jgi:hypothetical protein
VPSLWHQTVRRLVSFAEDAACGPKGTFKMSRLLVLVATVGVVAAACGGNNEGCRTCPRVEGNWSMTYGTPTEACSPSRTPPASITITVVGSIARARINDTDFTGTVYDTYELTLRGNLPSADGGTDFDRADLRATFIQGTGDGGVDRLTGTWSFTPAPGTCTETRELNGTRQ